jgi:7-alpha-hydroxysteroid dehydrogenase
MFDPAPVTLYRQVALVTGACVVMKALNAGGGGPKRFDMPMDDFRRAFARNLVPLFRLTRPAAPQIGKAGSGAALNTSSMAGENRDTRTTPMLRRRPR